MTAVSQHNSMGFKSIIPADRIKVDGNPSRTNAIIYWTIEDVYDYKRRRSIVNLVEYSKLNKLGSANVERVGSGIVPLRIEIESKSSLITVIF